MAMQAFGLYTHIASNNRKSVLLLALFPLLVGLSVLGAGLVVAGLSGTGTDVAALQRFLLVFLPLAGIATAIWFAIEWFGHQALIDAATGARGADPVETGEAFRLLENLCISRGMTTPTLRVIDTPALNAFASGLSDRAMNITLTRGLLDTLDRDELEAVLAHELTHIRNRDVRLVVIAAVFVGVAALVAELLFRSISHVNLLRSDRSRRSGGGEAALLIVLGLALAVIAYALSVWARFALSRRREYLADAGAVELTKNPDAMASALLKVSGRSEIEGVPSGISELFLDHRPRGLDALLATHPSIEERIEALQLYAGARAVQAGLGPGGFDSAGLDPGGTMAALPAANAPPVRRFRSPWARR